MTQLMKSLVLQRATAAYALMLVLTAVSFWLTVGRDGAGLGESSKLVWTQILALAGIKVRLVVLDFMELRTAPWRLRLTFELFVVAFVASLITINYTV